MTNLKIAAFFAALSMTPAPTLMDALWVGSWTFAACYAWCCLVDVGFWRRRV